MNGGAAGRCGNANRAWSGEVSRIEKRDESVRKAGEGTLTQAEAEAAALELHQSYQLFLENDNTDGLKNRYRFFAVGGGDFMNGFPLFDDQTFGL